MRVVVDTASFITALRSAKGAAAEVIRLVLRGELVALMDHKLGLEYRSVALRPEHVAASGLSAAQIVELIESIEDAAEPVEVKYRPRPMSSDPNDDMILDLAINGIADAIMTGNARHFRAVGKRFGIAVLSPSELLKQRSC